MNLFSNTAFALCTAGLLLTGITTVNATQNQNMTYTASGKTNIETVKLFKHLLKNSRNLTVTTKITHRPKQQMASSAQIQHKTVNQSFDYTIKGKTSLANVKKLMSLFNNNKNIEMIVEANSNSHNNVQVARFTINNTELSRPNQTYTQSQSVYSHYYSSYVPYNVWRVTEQFNGYPMPTKAQLHKNNKAKNLQHSTHNTPVSNISGFLI